MYVLIFATADTKGREATWLKAQLQAQGQDGLIVDCGCLDEPAGEVDITRQQLFAAAGTSHESLRKGQDRGLAVNAAARGATQIALESASRGELAGVLGIGGSAGTTIATAAMRALPLGLPKVMVSSLTSGNVRPYVGGQDILMLHSVVDFAGMNRVSRKVLGLAVGALVGMTKRARTNPCPPDGEERPLVATTMFGVTTPCVGQATKELESVGYEVLVFHATGAGGESFEALARSGLLAGVLDLTTTELADELVGGILSAGATRLTAAGAVGLPQVVSVGATDMVNFGPRASVPQRFSGRRFVEHNENVTLMRTTTEECRKIGETIARKLVDGQGPRAILLPARGVSALDCAGAPFEDHEARSALFAAIEEHRGSVPCKILDCHINDPQFAQAATRKLLELMQVEKHC